MEIRLHVTVEGRHTTNQTMLVSLFVLGLNEIVVSGSGDVIAIEAPFKTGAHGKLPVLEISLPALRTKSSRPRSVV